MNTLTFEIEDLAKTAKQQFDQFIKYYEKKGITDMKVLSDHPLTHALYNILDSKSQIFRKLQKMGEMEIIDTITHMRLEKVDRIVEMVRDPRIGVAKLDKL